MDSRIPQINSLCCCSLKTATMVIGITQFTVYLLYLIDSSRYIISYTRRMSRNTFTEFIGELFLEQSIITTLIFSLVLIYGAYKEKSNFIMAWQLFEIASIIDGFVNFIWNVLVVRYWEFYLDFAAYTVWDSLLVLVVYSYYRKIPKNKYILYYQYPT